LANKCNTNDFISIPFDGDCCMNNPRTMEQLIKEWAKNPYYKEDLYFEKDYDDFKKSLSKPTLNKTEKHMWFVVIRQEHSNMNIVGPFDQLTEAKNFINEANVVFGNSVSCETTVAVSPNSYLNWNKK